MECLPRINADVVDELEQVRLLVLRPEVADADRLVAADAHERDAAGLRALRGNAFEAELGGRLFAGGRLLERGVGAGEAEAEEVDDGGRDGARPGGADVVIGIELRALAAAAAIGEAGDRAVAEDVLAMVAPTRAEDVLVAQVVVALEVALVGVLAAVALARRSSEWSARSVAPRRADWPPDKDRAPSCPACRNGWRDGAVRKRLPPRGSLMFL